MPADPAVLAEAKALRQQFEALGGQVVTADLLLPSETLLDLYGEDIRARAYVTQDPIRGEMMLRPDFTLPVVQMHMETFAEPARYTYSGKVFRKQEDAAGRPSEYIQVGYEVFDGKAPAKADAEVYAAIAKALDGLPVRASTGDIGILMAAVRGLSTLQIRKDALLRHIWRPRRFRALLDRYGGRSSVPLTRAALLASADPWANAGPDIGLRDRADIEARLAFLREDASAPPLSSEEIGLIDAILSIRESAPIALSHLRDIAVDLPAIGPAVARMSERLDALAAKGVDVDDLDFEGSYGRTSLEYYDGFVFGFTSTLRPDLPAVATGGRYDALTRVLGQGRSVPAVGAVIRPDIVHLLREGAQ